MTSPNTPFFKFILSGQNRIYLGFTIPFAIVSFIILRNLYPIPSFYSDSFTWVGAAISRQPISFRPVGYSKLLIFFRYFSSTAVALVAGQYAVTLLTNLFLFFTFAWFFPLKNVYKALLYILLIVNPFYLFASNYVYSDAFFNPLSVLWFTLFIWILHKPSPFYIILQIILLACLFNLRYNAIVFPGISAVGILLTSSSYKKKAVAIAANFMVIIAIWIFTTYQTKSYTGIKTFSAFSGWQLANDAIHVLRHSTIDTLAIKDEEVKAVTTYTIHFFDTTKTFFADTSASALYMWERVGPLKKYMYVYPKRNRSYFKTWNALGPVYSKFGQTIILQHPFVYLKHFAIPNAKAYFLPPLEAYATYMENRTTIPGVVTKFYKYKSNKTSKLTSGLMVCGTILGGCSSSFSSPNKSPHGLRLSILSKTTLLIAIIGIDKNIPGMPQVISPINTPNSVISAFIFTLDPTIRGRSTLLSIRCIATIVTTTKTIFVVTAPVPTVISVLKTSAVKMPMYGIILNKPVMTPNRIAYLIPIIENARQQMPATIAISKRRPRI